jgi:hypothetical protein
VRHATPKAPNGEFDIFFGMHAQRPKTPVDIFFGFHVPPCTPPAPAPSHSVKPRRSRPPPAAAAVAGPAGLTVHRLKCLHKAMRKQMLLINGEARLSVSRLCLP